MSLVYLYILTCSSCYCVQNLMTCPILARNIFLSAFRRINVVPYNLEVYSQSAIVLLSVFPAMCQNVKVNQLNGKKKKSEMGGKIIYQCFLRASAKFLRGNPKDLNIFFPPISYFFSNSTSLQGLRTLLFKFKCLISIVRIYSAL